ncbi:bifunctional diaminohydroxyphosphoribosylaminopyrimidine deaminase/5-amino-6-(5-phosphoribosylamino)uracil reductase RibD [Rhodococcus sp. HNM0569]|uniref:bifunctional diaminohydroxyphosphoribosylaminopyrimidine deaminase/5-amino-6-(5-phosphoribosylamino)uracil reductase RibD n=1 Tax=Rhodococcus sp. HNM0569 TaxID=2716340 RepID=UPI00146D97A8|nr:bifunctional diaminohydroxyphosphoribosylaminopyrimidine deaminase/5-amino-6-(5-phosphoribosylamino)uracil reductase RibD [Rhodococcus sp. HNM0569]NLU81239.1 bifunctional diaminohydroxyphosphoribosylaminopyrimidine deaminase/5-amino-6-(5-phosphoribosylamino)uracil reductase RibD [Rhodococcus sp. HNM0569]
MLIAIGAAESARGFTSPNPPVGAVVLDAQGRIAGVGMTQPPGGPHAEVVALAEAGRDARGGTAIVTLEPCNHHGRTGPCSQALLDAGIREVHYAVGDPNPAAAGGAETLVRGGVHVSSGVRAADVERGSLRAWLHRQRTGRPHVTWKYAASLDGRSAAADGTSKWITGSQARARVHEERAKLDAVVVGTGTVLADDPWLTARVPDGTLAAHQPTRVVVGLTPIPESARVLDDSAPTLVLPTRDMNEVAEALAEFTDVLVEGGPRLAGAFLAAGMVDRIQAFVAPLVLGAGASTAVDAGVDTLAAAHRFTTESVETIGPDVLLSLVGRDRHEPVAHDPGAAAPQRVRKEI